MPSFHSAVHVKSFVNKSYYNCIWEGYMSLEYLFINDWETNWLTRSSSAVRLGVRMGACGTLGSLPRLGGSGSRGKPLHISFKEDILERIFCHTREQTTMKAALTLSSNRPLWREKLWGRWPSPYCLIGFLVVFPLRNPPMVRRCLVIIYHDGSFKQDMLQWTNTTSEALPNHITWKNTFTATFDTFDEVQFLQTNYVIVKTMCIEF